MHSQRKKRGFTLAETLLTVMIIIILCGVTFIMVMRYLRAMAQLERDGIAKEIFVAAQNHLTMAESQGYLGKANYGTKDEVSKEGDNIYYFVVEGGKSFGKDDVLDLMLPFASVDETVRLGGRYIVRYQTKPALMLDVFYCSASGTRFGHDLSANDYESLLGLRDEEGNSKKMDRRNYGNAVIGWYGGEEAKKLEIGDHLEEPTIRIINAERLVVEVTDPNKKYELKLIVEGEKSQARIAFTLESLPKESNIKYDTIHGVYTVTLDDVTTNGHHFSELMKDFIPGDNIKVKAVAFSNSFKTNIAYSAEKITNSLYAEIKTAGASADGSGSGQGGGGTGSGDPGGNPAASGTGLTAVISNIRHLENLDKTLSGVNEENSDIQIASAEQTTDLDWKEFLSAIGDEKARVYRSGSNTGTKEGCYQPAVPGYALTYDGQSHSISNIKTDTNEKAGLFGELASQSAVANLMLIDFEITSTAGDAGTLAGAVNNTEITNVLAHGKESAVSAAGNAGGLIGSMKDGNITAGAASVYVKSTGNGYSAGGLIGSVSAEGSGSVKVKGCYAGGHTEEGKYTASADKYNVVANAGTAGGLAGTADKTSFEECYSTCSVSASTAAGGFAGEVSGKVTDCYATGLIDHEKADTAGAFAGNFSGNASGCKYFEMINEKTTEDGIVYLTSGGKDSTITGVSPLDLDLSAFDTFTADPWSDAGAYDDTLIKRYQGKYNLRTVSQLDSNLDPDQEYFVSTHYGDWPSPEILFENRLSN